MSFRLLGPLPTARWPRVTTAALCWLGHFLGLLPLSLLFDLDALALAAAYLTGLRVLVGYEGPARWRRVVRLLAVLPMCFASALQVYGAVIVASTAGWACPSWAWLVVAATAAAALGTHVFPPRRGPWIPFVLPLGLVVAGCHLGWMREESAARCEDYARLRAQRDVALVVPTTAALARCTPGGRVPIDRYPRKVFFATDHARYLFTTQPARRWPFAPRPRSDLAGSVCEAPIDGHASAHCLGVGRGHGLFEAPTLGLIFAPVATTAADHLGLVYALSAEGPLRVVRATPLPLYASNGYYEAGRDVVTVLADRATVAVQMRGGDQTPLPPRPLLVLPHEVRFDAARGEGLVCSGSIVTGLATVFRAHPFAARHLRVGPLAPLLPFTWGCDWDAAHRRVFVTLPFLGLLATSDRTADAVVGRAFIGFGARPLAFDEPRERLYTAHFLRGDVVALDPRTGRETARWFVGRFVRDLRLAPDGQTLLATSNLGLARITLGATR